MLMLSVLSLAGLAAVATGRLEPQQARILNVADDLVCGLFFVDFLLSLYRAPSRAAYFLRWGWLDLLSSIPMVDAFRIGRLARIFRIIRVIRGVKATKIIAEFVLRRRAASAFIAVALLSLLLIIFSSIAILQFETSPDANIKTASDALWWAATTITTVGYGDRYPVTGEGRLIATVLMVSGVGLFGTLSGFVASWFLKPEQEQRDTDLVALLADVRELKALVASTEDRN
jgi:voltage-gated potassium channel